MRPANTLLFQLSTKPPYLGLPKLLIELVAEKFIGSRKGSMGLLSGGRTAELPKCYRARVGSADDPEAGGAAAGAAVWIGNGNANKLVRSHH